MKTTSSNGLSPRGCPTRWAVTNSSSNSVEAMSSFEPSSAAPTNRSISPCSSGAALVLPFCNSEVIEIATKVGPGAHAIIILDQAGWHGAKELKVPRNISLMPMPPRSPELNSQENIWQFMRQNWLSNRVFKSYDDIVDHCCYAWNTLIAQPWKIMSIGLRDCAYIGRSI
jgi:hypothetical protein